MCIYLPRYVGEEQAEEISLEAMSVSDAKLTENVLAIGDEPLVRMLVVNVLEDLEYTAIEAGDGPSGMKILWSNLAIDLLITDVGLPIGMNGRQVADAAREWRPTLKILFITGFAENAVLCHGHIERDMHILTKPFDISELARRIKQLPHDH